MESKDERAKREAALKKEEAQLDELKLMNFDDFKTNVIERLRNHNKWFDRLGDAIHKNDDWMKARIEVNSKNLQELGEAICERVSTLEMVLSVHTIRLLEHLEGKVMSQERRRMVAKTLNINFDELAEEYVNRIFRNGVVL